MKCPTLKFRFTQITANLVNFVEAIAKIKIWTKQKNIGTEFYSINPYEVPNTKIQVYTNYRKFGKFCRSYRKNQNLNKKISKSNQNQIMKKTEKHWPGVLHYKYNLDIYKKVDITCYLLHE